MNTPCSRAATVVCVAAVFALPACSDEPEGEGEDTIDRCADGIDNDHDGLEDCADPRCQVFPRCAATDGDSDTDSDSDSDTDSDSDADLDADCDEVECERGTICCDDEWGARCVDPNYDDRNCGGCGTVCDGGRRCGGGVCSCDELECDGECVWPNDPDHCGDCATACPEGERLCLWGGECTPCEQVGWVECSGDCFDLDTSAEHCGACGTSCNAGHACVSGSCVSGEVDCLADCEPGTICCGEECVDPNYDDRNCGGCGTVCDGGRRCGGGVCSCDEMECDGECVWPNDPDHCGDCETACPEGQRLCMWGGECTPCEQVGWMECSGECFDLDTSVDHCGGCGASCEAGEACVQGSCIGG